MLRSLKKRVVPAPFGVDAQGYSIHIGLNWIDPRHYGTRGELRGCEADAHDMHAMAKALSFDAMEPILSEHATRETVINSLRLLASWAGPGDLVLITYSGHGTRIPDRSGDERVDRKDEALCLYDGMMPDDEVLEHFCGFRAGVRIVAVVDACHSGSITRALGVARFLDRTAEMEDSGIDPRKLPVFRSLPDEVAMEAYRSNEGFYQEIARSVGKPSVPAADIMAFGACDDEQFASDLRTNGLFTSRLKQVWAGGSFTGSYSELAMAIKPLMPVTQTPQLDLVNVRNRDFPLQPAFRIGSP